MQFEHKLVAVLNKEIETGVAMNALAHMSIGLGAGITHNDNIKTLRLDDYKDIEGNIYPAISEIPFIILRAKSNEIRKTVHQARSYNMAHSAFLNTMTIGTYVEQLARTRNSREEELVYYGCVIFGDWDKVTELTRKFSLWQ